MDMYGCETTRKEPVPHDPAKNRALFAGLIRCEIPHDHPYSLPTKFEFFEEKDDRILRNFIEAYLIIPTPEIMREKLQRVGVDREDLATDILDFCVQWYTGCERIYSIKMADNLSGICEWLQCIFQMLRQSHKSLKMQELLDHAEAVQQTCQEALKRFNDVTKKAFIEELKDMMGKIEEKFETNGLMREYCKQAAADQQKPKSG